MKCTSCGAEIQGTDRFCGICGNPNTQYGTEGLTDGTANAIADKTENDIKQASVTEEAASGSAETPVPPEAASAQTDIISGAPKEPAFSNGENFQGIAAFPVPNPQAAGSRQNKEKKVVSLSVAIFCISAVFILSVICGVLAQLYIGCKSKQRISAADQSYNYTQIISGGTNNG